jgi:hypothetical protein
MTRSQGVISAEFGTWCRDVPIYEEARLGIASGPGPGPVRQLRKPLTFQAEPTDAQLSPDGRLAAARCGAGSSSGTPHTRRRVRRPYLDGERRRRRPLLAERPADRALQHCTVAGRTLTRAEWDELLPGRDYKPACAD